MFQACHLFLLNVLDEVRYLVKKNITATAGEALGVTALQMMAVLVSDSRDNIRLVIKPTTAHASKFWTMNNFK